MAAQEAVRVNDDDHARERHARILDAAERCFVRSGFHRTTMQDIAAEAKMSPGNLYRYFQSKDALVAGITERDRAEIAGDFANLLGSDDLIEGFVQLGRKCFQEEPREKAILCLQIWAEATRNPAFATVSRAFERDIVSGMARLLETAKAQGKIDRSVDPRALAVVVATLADGLFVRRAVLPDFDAEHEVGNVMAIIATALQGGIPLTSAPAQSADQAEGE